MFLNRFRIRECAFPVLFSRCDRNSKDFNCNVYQQVKTSDFEIVGTNTHRDDNENVSWNDVVEIFFKSNYQFKLVAL